jgi:hypothetical protein
MPQSDVTLICYGDVQKILAGEPLVEYRTESSEYLVGFMAGSPIGMSSVGEMLLAGGLTYTKSTDRESDSYFKVIHGESLITPAACMLPLDAKPSMHVTRPQTGTLYQLYEQLHPKVGGPFAYCGAIKFRELNGISLTDPPSGKIHFSEDRHHDAETLVFGAVSHPDDPLFEDLGRLIYRSSYEPDGLGVIEGHGHALVVKERVTDPNQVRPENVLDVFHILAGLSHISEIDLQIYPIGGIEIGK